MEGGDAVISMSVESDGLPDDRITCQQCTSMDRNGMCRCFKSKTIQTLRRRCIHFTPMRSLIDQRTGAQRWPTIVAEIQEVSRMDAAFEASHR